MENNIIDKVKAAGIVGAGGAGFPTHVKINTQAEIILANGAECEPLLRSDRAIMEKYPEQIIEGLKAVMAATNSKQGRICLKKKYKKAIESLKSKLANEKNIELFLMDNYYPAGDEQQMVFDVTGKTVPTGGLPIDVGAVVCNVSTLMNISMALKGGNVTYKYLTVTGEVNEPKVIKAPIGITIRECIKAAKGPEDPAGYKIIIGGPAMGYVEDSWDAVVTKTTGGIIVLKEDHPHIKKKTAPKTINYKLAKAVCCQCNYCTQLCPRNAIGLNVQPHKAMRAIGFNGAGLGDENGIYSCCNCGICTYYACNFGLNPSVIMTEFKEELLKNGHKPRKEVASGPNENRELIKVPVSRFIQRLGLSKYDVDVPFEDVLIKTDMVKIPLCMHIGAPCEPVVKAGDNLNAGDLIGAIREKSLGANIHASIKGTVEKVNKDEIIIKAN